MQLSDLKVLTQNDLDTLKHNAGNRMLLAWCIGPGGYVEAAHKFSYFDPLKPVPAAEGGHGGWTVDPNKPEFQAYAKEVRAFLYGYVGHPEWAW